MSDYRNPFRAWFQKQPKAKVTQYTLAKDLEIHQSYVCDLLSERNIILPSLTVAVKIEKITKGEVTPKAIYDFAVANRAEKAALADA